MNNQIKPDYPSNEITDFTNLPQLSINNEQIFTQCDHQHTYHYNYRNNHKYPNVDMNIGHVRACGVCAKHMECGKIKAGIIDTGEYNLNGKPIVDKYGNFIAKTTLINSNYTVKKG